MKLFKGYLNEASGNSGIDKTLNKIEKVKNPEVGTIYDLGEDLKSFIKNVNKLEMFFSKVVNDDSTINKTALEELKSRFLVATSGQDFKEINDGFKRLERLKVL